jgi:hypothetical protein
MRQLVAIVGVIAVLGINMVTFTYMFNVKNLEAVTAAYSSCLANQKEISNNWLSSGKNNLVSIPSCTWGR